MSFLCLSFPRKEEEKEEKLEEAALFILLSPAVGMATQAYGSELQAAPGPAQPPQATAPPPTATPQPPPPPPAAPQPQYAAELQNPQPPAQPPGGQKQYLTELPAGPAASQPVSAPSLSPATQQFIVVTVSGKWVGVGCPDVGGTLCISGGSEFLRWYLGVKGERCWHVSLCP